MMFYFRHFLMLTINKVAAAKRFDNAKVDIKIISARSVDVTHVSTLQPIHNIQITNTMKLKQPI